jgi:hypothetical protein
MFIGMTWEKMLTHELTIRMILVLGSFCFLFAFMMGFMNEGQTIRAEKRVAEFAEKYNAGDTFWAVHRSIDLDDFYDKQSLRNKIYHIQIKEFKKAYFIIEDSFRPKMWPNRISMDDFIIFESKQKMISYIKQWQQVLKNNMNEALTSV